MAVKKAATKKSSAKVAPKKAAAKAAPEIVPFTDPVESNCTPDLLKQLGFLVQMLATQESLVDKAAEAMKAAKEAARRLAEEDIPCLMAEAKVAALTLEDGVSVTIKDDVYAAIPAARRDEAYTWLEDHGFGGLIKTEVAVMFGREELKKATALFIALQKKKLDVELTRGVHAQTLGAFLREQIEASNPIPLELFGARPVKVAKIKPPKASKAKAKDGF
jgi:hypothetical protein